MWILLKAQNLLGRVVTVLLDLAVHVLSSSSSTGSPLNTIKITNITFPTLHCSQPAYLRSSLHACHSTRSPRLSNTNLLSASFVRTSFGARSFSVAAAKVWNSLPLSLRIYLYQSWYLLSSPQDPLLPAGLPIHLAPLLLRLRFGFANHCARL